jgi:hypothetical protein
MEIATGNPSPYASHDQPGAAADSKASQSRHSGVGLNGGANLIQRAGIDRRCRDSEAGQGVACEPGGLKGFFKCHRLQRPSWIPLVQILSKRLRTGIFLLPAVLAGSFFMDVLSERGKADFKGEGSGAGITPRCSLTCVNKQSARMFSLA